MLTITIRFRVRPEWCDRWLDLVAEFTEVTRAEEGCAWFWWSRSVEDPCIFYLLEGHREESVAAHLTSPLVPKITKEWPQALAATPTMLRASVPGAAWEPMDDLLPVPPIDAH